MTDRETEPLLKRSNHLRHVLSSMNSTDAGSSRAENKAAARRASLTAASTVTPSDRSVSLLSEGEESGSLRVSLSSQPPASSIRAVLDWSLDNTLSFSDLPSSAIPDPTSILQACVFVEDAVHYRSIHHRVDKQSLVIYRIYHSRAVQWSICLAIAVLLLLAFVEFPSSFTWSSDVRWALSRPNPPCGVTESVEVVCLLVLLMNVIMKSYLAGRAQSLKQFWLYAYFTIILISLLDWLVSVSMLCTEVVRVRRILRPFFLLQISSLMKKTVKCMWKTVPHFLSVLLLLFMHLYFFTLIAMLLFPKPLHAKLGNITVSGVSPGGEQHEYFPTLVKGFINILVLLTTANNPDVTMPAYSENRLYAIFFIVYLIIGLYCLMNMLTAVIYNQFRGYFTESIQTSLFRRSLAVRAAFEVLRMRRVQMRHRSSFSTNSDSVAVEHLRQVLTQAHISPAARHHMLFELEKHTLDSLDYTTFHEIFLVLDRDRQKKPRPPLVPPDSAFLRRLQTVCSHDYFNYAVCAATLLNVLCITLELQLEFEHIRQSKDTYLGLFNLLFIVFYVVEQCLKLWALGWRRYCWDRGNIFDGLLTLALAVIEITAISLYGGPYIGEQGMYDKGIPLWGLVRVKCLLILARLLRMVVSQIKTMSVVASTLLDLIKNLRAFAGLMVVIFYSYALVGMELFRDKIQVIDSNKTNRTDFSKKCGSYEQLEYWANNFDDFASSLVVLWDVMIVNNWHVFLDAYSRYAGSWAQLYFVFWWLLAVVVGVNLFTALLIENFIMRWDRQVIGRSERREDGHQQSRYVTLHDMFRDGLQEPSEEAILGELRHHPHFTPTLTPADTPTI